METRKITIYDGSSMTIEDSGKRIQAFIAELHPELLDWTLVRINIEAGLPHSDYGQTIALKFVKNKVFTKNPIHEGKVMLGA